MRDLWLGLEQSTRPSSVDHFWLVKRQDADAQAALRAKLLELPTEAWHCQLNMQQLWIFGPPEGLKNLDMVGWKVTHFFCREYIFEGLYFHCHFWFSRGSILKLNELKKPNITFSAGVTKFQGPSFLGIVYITFLRFFLGVGHFLW